MIALIVEYGDFFSFCYDNSSLQFLYPGQTRQFKWRERFYIFSMAKVYELFFFFGKKIRHPCCPICKQSSCPHNNHMGEASTSLPRSSVSLNKWLSVMPHLFLWIGINSNSRIGWLVARVALHIWVCSVPHLLHVHFSKIVMNNITSCLFFLIYFFLFLKIFRCLNKLIFVFSKFLILWW